MNIQVVQFDERVGMGTFAPWLKELGCDVKICRADRNQLPVAGQEQPVLLLGGYMGVNERERLSYLTSAAEWLSAEVERGRMVLAICLGAQLLAHSLGATVHSQFRQEKGIREISLTAAGENDLLLNGLPSPFSSFEWHNDSFELPQCGLHLAQTEHCVGQVFRYKNAWGVQFHPEVDQQIVADWCQRTGAGERPVQEFRQQQAVYFRHSRQLLENFIAAC